MAETITNQAEWLKRMCAVGEEVREDMRRPFVVTTPSKRYLVATNGAALLALESTDEAPSVHPDSEEGIVGLLGMKYRSMAPVDLGALRAWAGEPRPMLATCETCKGQGIAGKCSGCRGTGKCECTCGTGHSCGRCGGRGGQRCEACKGEGNNADEIVDMRGGVLAGQPICRQLLATVLWGAQGPVVLGTKGPKASMLRFEGKGWVALVMGCTEFPEESPVFEVPGVAS